MSLDDVIVGDSCGPGKISYHIMLYDGEYAWDIGRALVPPFHSSQCHFIRLLRAETLRNPSKWFNLTYMHVNGMLESVIDLAPYNSKGNQAFRTILSSKVWSTHILTC